MRSPRRHRFSSSLLRSLAIVAAVGAGGGACLVSFGDYKLAPGAGGGGTGGGSSSGGGTTGTTMSLTSSGTGATGSTGSTSSGTTTSSGSTTSSTSSASSSGMMCTGGCPGTMTCCSATCVDTTADMHNCGACGHDCQGGTCTASACQPLQISGTGATPYGIAVDSASVYWIEGNGNVFKVPTGGGSQTMLGNIGTKGQGIAVLGSKLYATDYGSGVWSLSTTPSTPASLASISASGGLTTAIVADTSNVYFATWGEGLSTCEVAQAPIGGGGTTELDSTVTFPVLTAPVPFNVAVDATHVYWTNPGNTDNGGSVQRAPIGGGTVETIAAGQAYPWGLVIYSGSVYWTNFGTMANTFTDGSVMKLPIGTSSITTLVSNVHTPTALAVDASGVYFTILGAANARIIAKVPLAGAASATTLATLTGTTTNVADIAVDATNIYFSQQHVYKLAK